MRYVGYALGMIAVALVILTYIGASTSPSRSTAKNEEREKLPFIGKTVTMKATFFGCQVLDDLDKVTDLAWAKKDKVAALIYGNSHCITLAEGGSFKIDDSSVWHGASCVRQVGNPDCYWTKSSLLNVE